MGLLIGVGNTKPTFPYDKWYGVQGDFTSTDYKLERVGNMDLHRTLPIQKKLRRFVENPDGTVKYYLHQNDSRMKESGAAAILDSTDGNVMLEKPEYYFRLEIEGTKWLRAWSEYPLPGFVKMERKTISPWFATIDMTSQTAVSGSWLVWDGDEIARDENGYIILSENASQYRGGAGLNDKIKDGTYNSQLGMPRTSINKVTVRKYCKDGLHIGVYRTYDEIAWLQRCEYASLHVRDTYISDFSAEEFPRGGLGGGCVVNADEWKNWANYKPFVPCGVTATLGNNTGKVFYTVKEWSNGDKIISVTSYRGLETPFEYLYMLADDVLIYHDDELNSGKSIAYICNNPKLFTSHLDDDLSIPDGYIPIAELPRKNGYILNFHHSSNGLTFPANIGGSATTGVCDLLNTSVNSESPSYGWFCLLLSGSGYTGLGCGFSTFRIYNRSDVNATNFGFRIARD